MLDLEYYFKRLIGDEDHRKIIYKTLPSCNVKDVPVKNLLKTLGLMDAKGEAVMLSQEVKDRKDQEQDDLEMANDLVGLGVPFGSLEPTFW